MDRRLFLTALGTLTASPSIAAGTTIGLRGTLDAGENGVRPGPIDQTAGFQRLLNRAARQDRPVYVPPGRYVVGDLDLPPRVRLMGLARSAVLAQAPGTATILKGTGCESVRVEGLVLEGAGHPGTDDFTGLIHLRACPQVRIEDCTLQDAGANAIALERCGGTVADCTIRRAAGLAALYAVESTGLTVRANDIADCANGGVLVHRWKPGEDRTLVAGNRIERIGATRGGTGQHGNGINVFQAHGVTVSDNTIADCAFSAIRGNGASNALVAANQCWRSGETGIYAEFAFQGSVVADNVVEGATIGISIANFDQGGRLASCTGNLVRGLRTEGPYPPSSAGFGHGIYAEADTVLADNVVEGAPNWGLGLGWGPYLRGVVAKGNVVRASRVGAAVSVAPGAGPCLVSDNLFADTPEGAVVPHLWLKPEGRGPQAHANVTARGNVTT